MSRKELRRSPRTPTPVLASWSIDSYITTPNNSSVGSTPSTPKKKRSSYKLRSNEVKEKRKYTRRQPSKRAKKSKTNSKSSDQDRLSASPIMTSNSLVLTTPNTLIEPRLSYLNNGGTHLHSTVHQAHQEIVQSEGKIVPLPKKHLFHKRNSEATVNADVPVDLSSSSLQRCSSPPLLTGNSILQTVNVLGKPKVPVSKLISEASNTSVSELTPISCVSNSTPVKVVTLATNGLSTLTDDMEPVLQRFQRQIDSNETGCIKKTCNIEAALDDLISHFLNMKKLPLTTSTYGHVPLDEDNQSSSRIKYPPVKYVPKQSDPPSTNIVQPIPLLRMPLLTTSTTVPLLQMPLLVTSESSPNQLPPLIISSSGRNISGSPPQLSIPRLKLSPSVSTTSTPEQFVQVKTSPIITPLITPEVSKSTQPLTLTIKLNPSVETNNQVPTSNPESSIVNPTVSKPVPSLTPNTVFKQTVPHLMSSSISNTSSVTSISVSNTAHYLTPASVSKASHLTSPSISKSAPSLTSALVSKAASLKLAPSSTASPTLTQTSISKPQPSLINKKNPHQIPVSKQLFYPSSNPINSSTPYSSTPLLMPPMSLSNSNSVVTPIPIRQSPVIYNYSYCLKPQNSSINSPQSSPPISNILSNKTCPTIVSQYQNYTPYKAKPTDRIRSSKSGNLEMGEYKQAFYFDELSEEYQNRFCQRSRTFLDQLVRTHNYQLFHQYFGKREVSLFYTAKITKQAEAWLTRLLKHHGSRPYPIITRRCIGRSTLHVLPPLQPTAAVLQVFVCHHRPRHSRDYNPICTLCQDWETLVMSALIPSPRSSSVGSSSAGSTLPMCHTPTSVSVSASAAASSQQPCSPPPRLLAIPSKSFIKKRPSQLSSADLLSADGGGSSSKRRRVHNHRRSSGETVNDPIIIVDI